jgi:diguanylate cyclase (GGDEF)-like protein
VGEIGTATAGCGRQVSGDTTRMIVTRVRAGLGDDGVAQMLAIADEPRSATELEQDTCWTSYWQAKALFEAAVEVLGDPHAFRDLSAAHHATYAQRAERVSGETAGVFQSLGSPSRIYEDIAIAATHYMTVLAMEPVEITDDYAVVAAWATDGFPRYPELCDFTAGLLSSATLLFGFEPALVVEEACQARGDERCVYRVSWAPVDPEAMDPELRNRNLEIQVSLLTARLNTLRAAAADLVSGDDVDTVLARVVGRAGAAVRAPRFLLAVVTEPGGDPRVHHVGFTDEIEAGAFAERVMDDDAEGDASILVVDVESRRRRYGWLAASYAAGTSYFPEERPLLQTYARLAAAALDSATAIDEARRQADTARVLLALADSLAEIGPADEVAQRVADAVTTVIDAERSVVMLWDPTDEVLRTEGTYGLPQHANAFMLDLTISIADTPLVADLIEHAEPRFIDATTDDPFLHAVLASTGADTIVTVPIMGGGDFLGIVCAGTARSSRLLHHDANGVVRVRGLASQAAIALQNAKLLEQVRHQAMHDALTGLPGRALIIQLLEQALRLASRNGHHVGLLFADLDRLKQVNDTLGHHAGDEVIRAVAARLRGCLRDSDVLARLGGDEFVVLLPKVATSGDAADVARKMLASLRAPFPVCGHQLDVSASIGVVIAPGGAGTCDALLADADAAMYEAKARGGSTFSFHADGPGSVPSRAASPSSAPAAP